MILRLALLVALVLAPLSADAQISLTLTWDDLATDEDGFRIERGLAIGGPYTEINTVGANVVTYVDADPALVSGTRYCYRVRAFSTAGGNSGYSNPRCSVAGRKERFLIEITP